QGRTNSQPSGLSQSNTSRAVDQQTNSRCAPEEMARKLLPAGLTSTGGNMDSAYSAPEDNVVRLFEPDLITPEQHRDRIQPESTDRPEIRLMLAVMEDAVATFQRFAVEPGRRNQRLCEEAESWILSTDTSWPYSFENICSALKFEPETL